MAPILFWCARCSGTLVWVRPAAATPAGAGPAAPPPPPPRRGPFSGGGVPSAPGGRRAAPVAPKLEGGAGGGGGGAAPPAPPPRQASACLLLSPACPSGAYSRRWGCWAGAGVGRGPVGRRRVSAARGGGGRGGNPRALVRAPVFPGPASATIRGRSTPSAQRQQRGSALKRGGQQTSGVQRNSCLSFPLTETQTAGCRLLNCRMIGR